MIFRRTIFGKREHFWMHNAPTPSARLYLFKQAPSGSGNIFKLLAPISHVLARRSSLSSCPPPVLLILATQLLFCRHVQCFQTFFSSRPDICCDFYLYLTITIPQTHHVLLRLVLVSWKLLAVLLHAVSPHRVVPSHAGRKNESQKVLTFLFPFCRDAEVRKSIRNLF